MLFVALTLLLPLAALEIAARAVLPEPLDWLWPQLRYEPHPTRSFKLRGNQQAYTADKPVSINERGLRDPRVDPAPVSDACRLLFLGDSIVFGFGVGDDDVVVKRTESALRARGVPVEAINAAVPSYNSRQEVQYLEEEGWRFHPDWVVLGFFWNDLSEKSDAGVTDDGWLISEVSQGRSLGRLKRVVHSELGFSLRNLGKRSRLAYGALLGARALGTMVRPDSHTVWREQVLEGNDSTAVDAAFARVSAAFDRLRELSASHGFRVLVVRFPSSLAVGDPRMGDRLVQRVRDLSEAGGMHFLDVGEHFRASGRTAKELFIPYDADHPNALGHEIAAESIADFFLTAPDTGAGTRLGECG